MVTGHPARGVFSSKGDPPLKCKKVPPSFGLGFSTSGLHGSGLNVLINFTIGQCLSIATSKYTPWTSISRGIKRRRWYRDAVTVRGNCHFSSGLDGVSFKGKKVIFTSNVSKIELQ